MTRGDTATQNAPVHAHADAPSLAAVPAAGGSVLDLGDCVPALPEAGGLAADLLPPLLPARGPASYHPGRHPEAGLATQSTCEAMLTGYGIGGGGPIAAELPLRSISDPTRGRLPAGFQYMQQPLDSCNQQTAGAPPAFPMPGLGSGGSILDHSSYTAYYDATLQRYQKQAQYGGQCGPAGGLQHNVQQNGQQNGQHQNQLLDGRSTYYRGQPVDAALDGSAQQHPGMPSSGGHMPAVADSGSLQQLHGQLPGGCGPQQMPSAAYAMPAAQLPATGQAAPDAPLLQSIASNNAQDPFLPAAGYGMAPGAGYPTQPQWHPDVGRVLSFAGYGQGPPSAAPSSGEGSHDSAAGARHSNASSWVSPLDAAQSFGSYGSFPRLEADTKPPDLQAGRFAQQPGVPLLLLPPPPQLGSPAMLSSPDAVMSSPPLPPLPPQRQQQSQQHQTQRTWAPVAAAAPADAVKAQADRSQHRLRLQTGRPAPTTRGRRKVSLASLSAPQSPPSSSPVAAAPSRGGSGGDDSKGADAAAEMDAEAAAKAVRRHTMLREKNRRAQANARRRKKERMCESEAQIAELSSRIKLLEVEASDLAAQNALLQKVAELQGAQGAVSKQPSRAEIYVKEETQSKQQKEFRFMQARFAEVLTCMRSREANPVTIEETEAMDAVELLDLAQEMKDLLRHCLDEGGRDADSPAGKRLAELVRHIRIMRPFRLTWAWHRQETPGDIPKMWVWKAKHPAAIDPAHHDALKDEREAALGPRTPELWRRTLAAMELSDDQKAAMLAARRQLLADMGTLMRQRSRVVELLSLAAPATPSMDTLSGSGTLQAVEAAAELRGNLDAERAAVIAYWRSVHEELLQPWQEAAGIVAAWPHTIDSLALCNTLAADMGDAEAPAGFDVASLPADSPFRKFLAVPGESDGGLFRPMHVDTADAGDSEQQAAVKREPAA